MLENYLSGRTQKTRVGNVVSTSSAIEYGVPQGSVLGLLLFILYVNDILNWDCMLMIQYFIGVTQTLIETQDYYRMI